MGSQVTLTPVLISKTMIINDLKRILSQLQEHSQHLDELDRILGYSWRVVSEESEVLSFVFKKGQELLVSKAGVVSGGRYEVLHRANAVLIEYSGQKILFKQAFVDDAVIVLLQDGHASGYMLLANEALIPDLDVLGYLDRKYMEPLRQQARAVKAEKAAEEKAKRLKHPNQLLGDIDGEEVRVWFTGHSRSIRAGLRLTVGDRPAPDDVYNFDSRNNTIECHGGVISSVYFLNSVTCSDGTELVVQEDPFHGRKKGCKVLKDGKPAPDGVYKLGWLRKIRVEGGRIV